MTLLNLATGLASGQSSLYPIPPVSRSALSLAISDTATLDEAEATIRVALAMQYALRAGAFAPRMLKILRVNVLGLSQLKLGMELGYSQTAIAAWELGKADCPTDAYVGLVDLVRHRLEQNTELIRAGHAMRARIEQQEAGVEVES